MSDREEWLGDVLCALAFDAGRCVHMKIIEDGQDFDGLVNLQLVRWSDTMNKQALGLEHICATMAGLASACAEAGLVHPDSITTKSFGPRDPEQEWLDATAKECRCCPNCGNPPCPGCTAGGICDESDCYCGEALHDDPEGPQSSDDLDAEGEAP